MNTQPSAPRTRQKSPLVAEVERILSDAVGVRAYASLVPAAWGPLLCALGLLAVYSIAWLAVEVYAALNGWQREPKFVSLLAWGGLYFAAAFFFAKRATAQLIETVERDIQPHASLPYLKLVTSDLKTRYRPRVTFWLPVLVAALCLLAAIFAIDADIESGRWSRAVFATPEFWFWAVTYAIYFFTAAQAVVAARFYLSFADHLEVETGSFYVAGAADSPLIVGLARLSNQVLIFWLMIFLTMVTSMLLALPWLGAYAFPPRSWFLLILVPVAGSFSLGLGSLVYFSSEAKIRAVLRRFTQEKLAPVRERCNELFPASASDSPKARETLASLADFHDWVVAGGRYGSRIGAALSLALPLSLPIVSIVKLVIDF